MSLNELSRKDRIRLVRFVCSFAWADLEVVEAERKFVRDLVARLKLDDVDAKQVQKWLDHPPSADLLDPNKIPYAHRELFFESAKAMVLADGAVTAEEQENLDLLQALLEYA